MKITKEFFETMDKVTFKTWSEQLIKEAKDYGWGDTDPIEACGEECWKEYFDDGHTPSEALFTDASYGSG